MTLLAQFGSRPVLVKLEGYVSSKGTPTFRGWIRQQADLGGGWTKRLKTAVEENPKSEPAKVRPCFAAGHFTLSEQDVGDESSQRGGVERIRHSSNPCPH